MGDVARPSGVVTFLFTDIEGSTALWGSAPDAMSEALAQHDRLLREVFATHGGYVFATGGDGLAVAFGRVQDAVEAAATAQAALGSAAWPEGATLKVRMGLHVGEVEEREGDYFGPAVNRAARIMDAGHGGQVLASAPLVEIFAGDGFVSLGRHRLRGFGSPDEIWQLGDGSFPALRTPRQEGNLPNPVSSFVGREAELAETTGLLCDARLLTLVGVGGVGKTRLAIETARRSADNYADGVWFVDLASRGDPDGVAEAIAAVVGVVPQPGEPVPSALVDHLGQRWLLMVLDNCEHLLDAVAEVCSAVLASAQGLTVLATSREPLGIPGEQVWAIPSMAQAPDLFVERANEARAGFDPDAGERSTIKAICERLDGVPLAIELAAARTRSMTVPEISDALDDRFRLLRGSGRGGTERHQTLQSTVQWSVDLLNDFERELFESLSVFPADFDVAAAEAVCGSVLGADRWNVRVGLDRLVDRSLVTARGDSAVTRFRLLETFRQFGEQALDMSRAIELRRAHLDYFIELASEAGIGFWSRVEDPDPDPWDVEWDNILSAMHWALAEEDADACERLALASREPGSWFFDPEYVEWAIQAANDPNARMATLYSGAAALGPYGHGDFEGALALSRRGEQMDPNHWLLWTMRATILHTSGGDPAEIAESAAKAIELMPAELSSESVIYHGVHLVALAQTDVDAAANQATYLEGVVSSGLPARLAAIARNLLAIYSLRVADYASAIRHCEAAIVDLPPDAGVMVPVGLQRTLAEAKAGLGEDASTAYNTAIQMASDARQWGSLSRIFLSLINWWSDIGEEQAATSLVEAMTANGFTSPGLEAVRDDLAHVELTTARERGRTMDRTELLDYVMAKLDPVVVGGRIERHEDADLTGRQMEVAQLVARGLSNKDIARELDVSPYTVETHVRNILERLDATNRTQIVAWVKDNEPTSGK